ncbi:unnamed protein product [Rotaria sordida]|uniref:Uncharacterized protein n=1 Tax=Rotaria sordida TaxID=392033 RepID=A0A819A8G9_9BILA|nr:unnamed protein product [Rotaria sordida]CAF3780423.1 unnamed protein product [Rotaria sordida]
MIQIVKLFPSLSHHDETTGNLFEVALSSSSLKSHDDNDESIKWKWNQLLKDDPNNDMLHNSWRQSFNIRHLCVRELTIDEVLKRFTDYRRPATIVDASLKQSHHDQFSLLHSILIKKLLMNLKMMMINQTFKSDVEYYFNHLSIASPPVSTSQTNSLIILRNESIALLTIDESCYNLNYTGSNEISSSEKLSLTQQHEDELDTTKEDKKPCSIVKRKCKKH